MEKLNPGHTAVICIDMQREYFDPSRPLYVKDSQKVSENCRVIIDNARARKSLIVHVRHVSSKDGDQTFAANSPFIDFVDLLTPKETEPIVTKSRPGAFYDTPLNDILVSKKIKNVIICGLLSFMCCDTTAREAHARGYDVYFIKDATAAIDIGEIPAETIHRSTCAIQGWMFSTLMSTSEILKVIN